MLELDQILRANEVTVALVAAVPSLLIAGGSGYALLRWLTPSPPDRRREALPARCVVSSVPPGFRNFPPAPHAATLGGCLRTAELSELNASSLLHGMMSNACIHIAVCATLLPGTATSAAPSNHECLHCPGHARSHNERCS